jgi:hypothetical protein
MCLLTWFGDTIGCTLSLVRYKASLVIPLTEHFAARQSKVHTPVEVLILSPASARGVDLMQTYAFHLFEPHQHISEESQTLTRAVRYDSHKGMADPRVRVFQYITVFPVDKAAKADADLMMSQAARIFGPDQTEGISVATMLAALKMEIKHEKGELLVELQLANAEQKSAYVEMWMQRQRDEMHQQREQCQTAFVKSGFEVLTQLGAGDDRDKIVCADIVRQAASTASTSQH